MLLIKKFLFILISLSFLLFEKLLNCKYSIIKNEKQLYRNYIQSCNRLKEIDHKKINNRNKENPYFSIIIPLLNMEKYIEKTILSVLNQSFQDFEIIIINDFSNDNSNIKIQKYLYLNKIKIIEHKNNLGIYASRVDGFYNSNGKYLLYIDSDDMILNPFLLEKIYNYNRKYNLDIIEFEVYYKEERNNKIYNPNMHSLNHFHNFIEKIIYQPKLSNLLFFIPNSNNYSYIFCRNIWNKIIKKSVLFNTINFIGKEAYKKRYFNFAEDTLMNIINFQFANNYTNIKIPGYLYNIRENSISHHRYKLKINIKNCQNYLLFLKLFYKYIKYFNKNRNYLYFELKESKDYFVKLKDSKINDNINDAKNILNEILEDKDISKPFEFLLKNYINIF